MTNYDWEMRDLAEAIRRVQSHGGKVTREMMVQWKCGRGMLSASEMSSQRKRDAWIGTALSMLAKKGIYLG